MLEWQRQQQKRRTQGGTHKSGSEDWHPAFRKKYLTTSLGIYAAIIQQQPNNCELCTRDRQQRRGPFDVRQVRQTQSFQCGHHYHPRGSMPFWPPLNTFQSPPLPTTQTRPLWLGEQRNHTKHPAAFLSDPQIDHKKNNNNNKKDTAQANRRTLKHPHHI